MSTGVAAALWDDAGAAIGPSRLIGAALGAPPRSAAAPVLGAIVGAALGILAAPALYAIAFQVAHRADALTGTLAGIVHAAASGLVLPALFARAGFEGTPRPGAFARLWSPIAPFGIILSRLVYGALLGYLYVGG